MIFFKAKTNLKNLFKEGSTTVHSLVIIGVSNIKMVFQIP